MKSQNNARVKRGLTKAQPKAESQSTQKVRGRWTAWCVTHPEQREMASMWGWAGMGRQNPNGVRLVYTYGDSPKWC